MNDLAGMDLIPEPKIVIAALNACRRLDDLALAIRFMETVKEKCGPKVKEIYPYILQVLDWCSLTSIFLFAHLNYVFSFITKQEVRPTLDQLGVNTPEELGYDKPELVISFCHIPPSILVLISLFFYLCVLLQALKTVYE